ncbi:MAG: hypothetical protein KKG59_08000 [Nanoarchaeota archaeon]|nr:hypothetical protein [Nanoarchaeota archaeon]
MNKGTGAILLLLGLILLNSQVVSPAGIGVSKAELPFMNVLKSGYAENTFFVSTDSENNLSVTIEFRGATANWMSLKQEGQDMWVTRDHNQIVTVVLTPPAEVPNGIYNGFVRVKTGPISTPTDGRIGSSVMASFAIQDTVEIIGEEFTSCTPGGFSIPDTEEGKPIEFKVIMTNSGNINIRPDVRIDIWDRDKKNLLYTRFVQIPEFVQPTVTSRFFTIIPDFTLPIGQYWVDISIPLCEKEPVELEFSVLEKGGVSDRGQFLRLEHLYVVNTSEITSIRAVFKNTGERLVTAKFKGTIKKDNAVVKVIDTDTLDADPGQTIFIETFFEPGEPGKYEITGRVLYNNKLTQEKSSVMHANPTDAYIEEVRRKQRITYRSFIPLLVLMIAILVLLILIKRKRKKQKRHSERIVREKKHSRKKLHDWHK